MVKATTRLDLHAGLPPGRNITIFNTTFRLLWLLVAVLTIVLEVMPAHFPPALFYAYDLAKGVLFAALGYLTPLAFRRFHSLNLGFVFAGVSSAGVELLQGFIANGHAFTWIDLFAKLFIISFGFILGLNARYDHAVQVGRLRLRLVSDHGLPSGFR
jgi:glycopeptide antibiotics resistance protein